MNEAPLFDLFWENSKLNERTVLRMAAGLEADSRTVRDAPRLLYPTEDLELVAPKDKAAKLMKARFSCRAFSSAPIGERQLGSLFFAFSEKPNGTRMLPSAGAKYPIEVYALLFNVRSDLNGKVVYYNADNHSLSLVGTCPSWDDCNKSVGLELEGMPAAVFVFMAVANRVTDKYGERGGRFLLIEVGQYAQNLALRLAEENLGGVMSGALMDDEVKRYLMLDQSDALVTLGFVCGNIA